MNYGGPTFGCDSCLTSNSDFAASSNENSSCYCCSSIGFLVGRVDGTTCPLLSGARFQRCCSYPSNSFLLIDPLAFRELILLRGRMIDLHGR